jgi:CDP-glucose 4,6-dehydratase
MRSSYFNGAVVATARAGNVIGGGDWSQDRLVPDVVDAALSGRTPELRYPNAVRPWQHVLDANAGYQLLASRLYANPAVAQSWNFGPDAARDVTVAQLTSRLLAALGRPERFEVAQSAHPAERAVLHVDATKARSQLGWIPKLDANAAVEWTAAWYSAWHREENARELTYAQVAMHTKL